MKQVHAYQGEQRSEAQELVDVEIYFHGGKVDRRITSDVDSAIMACRTMMQRDLESGIIEKVVIAPRSGKYVITISHFVEFEIQWL